jgi:RNA polymerase sigma factor (sigma-70 family)
MPPPPASNVASRLFLGPALRVQPDRRLVTLVRDGYENAFEEIVRRYGRALGRYAAAIVPSHRAEDVTQDAFSKALLALRGSDKEIELRPWLYRIVRNTALNDLRDQPPAGAQLHEGIDGVETPAEAAERRAEIADVLQRLRALPDPQRAAIVMRELEGLSHEEIAAHLGMSGGAARQTIYRARQKLRDGAGLLFPLPLLHYMLANPAGDAAGAGLGGAVAAAAGTGAASAGGAGAGAALKAGLATVLVAGSVGTGVAIHESRQGANDGTSVARESLGPAAPATAPGDDSGDGSGRGSGSGGPGPGGERGGDGDGGSGGGSGEDSSGPGHGATSGESGSNRGSGGGDDGRHSGSVDSGSGGGGSGSSGDDSGSSGGSGTSGGGLEPSGADSTSSGSGSGSSGGSSGDGGGSSGSDGSGSGDGSIFGSPGGDLPDG